MENAAAYELAVRADMPRQQRGFVLPRLRNHRFQAAAYVAVWGAAGILSTTAPGVAANPDHVMLCFLFVMAGVLLLFLAIAAQEHPIAERAAAHLEGWIRALFYKEGRA